MMLTKFKITLATLVVLMASYPLSGCGENANDTRQDGGQYGTGQYLDQYLDPREDSDDDSASETQYEATHLERTSLPDTGGGSAEQ